MGAAAVELRGPAKVTEVAARSGFGKYGPGRRKRSGKAEVRQDEMLEQLKAVWRRCDQMVDECGHVLTGETYDRISSELLGLDYSSKDIECFSLILPEFQDEMHFSEKAGLFLSALINNGNVRDYIIHTSHFEKKIDHIGFRNRKNIVVNGNVGDIIGLRMKEGSIVVKGDARHYVGWRMEGGRVVVKGNAGKEVGSLMEGGEINLDGGYESRCKIRGGKIFHKGELIVDK